MYHVITAGNRDKFHELCRQPLTPRELVDIVMSTDIYYINYVIEHKYGDLFSCINHDGSSILYLASDPVIPVLLNHGINVNHCNHDKQNMLYALDDKDYSTALIFINNGIDVNHVDRDGDTPLIVMWIDESFKLVELLLEHGAILTDNADELLKVVYCIHHRCRQLKQQLNDYLEQTKDLTMYRDFYELCHF